MDAQTLRALQAPLKEKYKNDPASAVFTMHGEGTLEDNITCLVQTNTTPILAGLHPATAGTGKEACSGDMLLQALAACAGVTLNAVATAMEIPYRKATVRAEGEVDFRGTLGVSKEVPIGFTNIRLHFDIDTDAPKDKVDSLIRLTERYCVVYQTLKHPPEITTKY
jgi:uncharacterized OsmC-like protein